MKSVIFCLFMATLVSCSAIQTSPTRSPAAESTNNTCAELVKNILLSENYDQDLLKALSDKKLLTFTEKKAILHYPSLEWINKARGSFNTALRNWNNFRYPAFYLFSEEEIIPIAKRYAENLEKIIANQIPTNDDETTHAYLAVDEWTKAFQNYQTELDQLLEERISLQYNLSLLKKIKVSRNEVRDIQISIKRKGILENQIITLRKKDRNLNATINQLKLEIKSLDGSLISNGRIKDRIIRQAMLLDMLNIVHRELEFAIKNSANPSEVILSKLERLTKLLKNSDYSPSTYGVYQITNKIFIRELISASKLDIAYSKIKSPLLKLKDIVAKYFANKKTGTTKEKVGLFKRIYLKISNITPKQAAIGGGSLTIAGLGIERYFMINEKTVTELKTPPPVNQLTPEDAAHQEQLDQTREVEEKKQEGYSSALELNLEEFFGPSR